MAEINKFKIIKIGKSNFISGVFPFSLITKKSKKFQSFDCKLADYLPLAFASGFFSVWIKNNM